MPTLTIRPAAPADAPAILHLIKALATYEREPDAVEATVESITEGLFRPRRRQRPPRPER